MNGLLMSNGGAPGCLIIFGKNNVESVEKSGLEGKLIKLKVRRGENIDE